MRDSIVIPPGHAADTARQQFVTPGKAFQLLLSRLIRIGCLLVAAVGVAVLCGWIFDIPQLTRLLPGLAFMKITTACSLLAASISLWILHTHEPGSPWFPVARYIAALLVALGGLTLSEHLFGWDLGIDQHIAPSLQPSAHAAHLGRVSPASSFLLTFLGLALLTLKARRPYLAASTHWLVVPSLLVSVLAVLGYAYGADSLYAISSFASMAAHTAASFFVLSLCVLAADSAHGFAQVATSDTDGGLVSRRLLPTIPIMIFVLGWIPVKAQMFGLYDNQFGSALMVLLSITLCVIAVAWTAVTLHRVDLTRRLAEAEILSLNAGLEMRVQERTQELAQVSSQLRLVNGALELLSQQDGLTGLANRRFFDTYLGDQIDVARRYGRSLALVLFDVDWFKAYNDHYGHQAGDECLKRVAAALRSCCRRTADMAARYGGEEFSIILPDTGLSDALQIAEAARNAVAQMQIAHAKSPTAPYVSISGGIAILLHNGSHSAEQLVMAADQCLYRAKRLGRNRNVAEAVEIEAAIAS
jgi:diguanylate cyclase (GGDEF)-like protein